MNPKYLGDSYDIVKHSLLRWLQALGPWAVHPMFTEQVAEPDAAAFSRLIGAPLLSTTILSSDRGTFVDTARACEGHLFLDPDTGLSLKTIGGRKASNYVFGSELIDIATSRPRSLTLVFDQCIARGQVREGLKGKLKYLRNRSVHGLAYESHACFVLVSCDAALLSKARCVLQEDGHLPSARLLAHGSA